MNAKVIEFVVKVNGRVVEVFKTRQEASQWIDARGGLRSQETATVSHRTAKSK